MGNGACLTMNNIGKPCAGKPHARFDEGGQAEWPALYSTLLKLSANIVSRKDQINSLSRRLIVFHNFLQESNEE